MARSAGRDKDVKDAEEALSTIQPNFPDASVVEVSDKTPKDTVKKSTADLESEEKSRTPDEAQKEIRKAPPTVESAGSTLTPDNKKPGGDSADEPTEIG